MNKKFFIFFSVIIILAISFWLWRESMFSKEILKLEILGPEKAEAGSEIEYSLKYKNNGNFLLENAKMAFVLPENSLTEDGKTIITQNLKDVYPGDQEIIKIKARLLGKEGDFKTAKASVTYTPKNLTAKYESNTTFTTEIDKVPITLDFDLPSNVEQGKDLQYSINYFSNIDYPLENLSIKIDPVDGFNFISSDPPSLDNIEWKIKTLNKAQGGRITIKGTENLETNKTVSFSANLGIWQNGNFVVIKQASQEVKVIRPMLVISQQINGSSEYVASPGETLHYLISFTNIGSDPFENLYAIVRLSGQAIDMSSISPEGGRVQPNDNMIVFDANSSPQLRRLERQQTGQIKFDVKTKNSWIPDSNSGGSVILDEVNISQISQKFEVKINSGLEISQSGYYQSDYISNFGPIPPKVGKETTYTINWSIKNHSSDERNVKVKATLPQNVKPTGKILPENEYSNFSFDSTSREVVWSAGDILSGTGVNGDPVSLSFQVSLISDANQRGSTAQLIGQVEISGENQFTNTITTARDSAITTALPDDFQHSAGGIVQ